MPTVIAHRNGDVTTELDPDLLRASLMQRGNEIWIDITDPTRQQADILIELFGFDRDELEEVFYKNSRPHVETKPDYYFIVFYAGSCNPHSARIQFEPVYIFAGVNFLVTIHMPPMSAITETMNRWRMNGNPLESHVGSALLAVQDALVDDYNPVLDVMADLVDEVENEIFVESDQGPIQKIFGLKKNLLLFRRIVAPERDIVNLLLRRDLPIFTTGDMPVAQDLYNRMVRLAESIDLYRDLLSNALDSHISMQSNRLNETIRVLTVASILLMTNALIAGIYGMNFDVIPGMHLVYGSYILLGIMLLLGVGMFIIFRKKEWL